MRNEDLPKLAFVGAGNMASAIVRGILHAHPDAAARIACTSAEDGSGARLAEATGITYHRDVGALLDGAEWIVLAIKPQQLAETAPLLREHLRGQAILSILAGTTLARLQGFLPGARNYVRAMPNMPAQIRAGITAFAPSQELSEADRGTVRRVLQALGEVREIPEAGMDALTAVSGCGPAFLFQFVAALRDGGIAAGLSAEDAYALASQTVLGSARLLVESGESPETLSARVASKRGVTEKGLEVLAEGGLKALMERTVLAARDRSVELTREMDAELS